MVERAPDEVALDLVPTVNLVPTVEFVIAPVDAVLPNPTLVEGMRKPLLRSAIRVAAFAIGGLGTLALAAGAGFIRTFGVDSLVAAGTVLWDCPGTDKVGFCFGALLPTPFQTLLTIFFAEERKPNLLPIPFFADITKR